MVLTGTYINCAFREKSMKVGRQLQQKPRSIFKYSGVSQINDEGRKFEIFYIFY